MSKTQQVLSKTLTLPAIGSFQYLAAVDPGLITANGTVLRPYIDTQDKDLSFTVNADGTIDIYNVSGRNLAAGKKVVVLAADKWFNAPVGGEENVTTVASTPTLYPSAPNLLMNARATDNQTFVNTPAIILFDSSNVIPLVARGYIDDPGTQGGAFVVRKPGVYLFEGDFLFSATAGGAGTVTIQLYTNSAASSTLIWSRSVNFTGGVTDRALSMSYSTLITQAALDAAGGTRTIDFRIYSSAGTVTGKLGGSAATGTQSCSMNISYVGPDYFTAA